jgi:23S rRNA (cytidine2498-2'-O)-methyltransferase
MNGDDQFVFVVCQRGAELALKAELAARWPALRLSYSRPGLVTFKVVGDVRFPEDFDPLAVFARTSSISLGRLTGSHAEALADEAWRRAGEREFRHVHAWQRDARLPGDRGFEPGETPLARAVGETLAAAQTAVGRSNRPLAVNHRARAGDLVLDCVLVEPGEWLIGFHRAASVPSRFPGGVCLPDRDPDVISRAFWKMAEALTWSRFPIERGDGCAEIGCSPGGASQALLAAGCRVLGIDPADVDERLLTHPRFTHVKKRAADMKRREFRDVRWLMADLNVTPRQALETVEAIVTHREVHVRGLLLTLKLPDWQRAARIPDYVERVRSWGYHFVQARQLAFNRREICVAALRRRSLRRRAAAGKRRP